MLFLLLLFLAHVNVAYVAKLEDILPCINDADCNESIDSSMYTPSSKVNGPVLDDVSDDMEGNDLYIMNISTDIITSFGNLDVTEQTEIQSTVTTISPPTFNMSSNNAVVLKFEKREICECNLIVRIDIKLT